jgi:Trypsin
MRVTAKRTTRDDGAGSSRRPADRRHRRHRLSRLAGAAAVVAVLGVLAFTPGPAGAIVGGTAVPSSAHPYFVTVIDADGFLCGGSIIDADVVLTAAHCMASSASVPWQVVVKVHDTTPVHAVAVTIHPLWNDDLGDGHDLAVVRLPAGSTAGIDPIVVGAPLDASAYAAGNEATTIGHGATYDDGGPTAELREVQVPIRSDGYMSDIYDPWWWTDEWAENLHIGAGSSGQTICYGDSGGPLMVNHNGRTVQIGVSSFGFPDAYDFDPCDVPGAFSELDGHQLAWLGVTVPGIQQRWSDCVDGVGRSGRPTVSYLADTQFHQEFSTTRCDTGAPPPEPAPDPLPRQCRPPNRNTCQEP